MSEFPGLAEAIDAHSCSGTEPGHVVCYCSRSYWDTFADWSRHVADSWREACTITTVEQLDNPYLNHIGTIIKEIHTPDCCEAPWCDLVPVVWEMVNQMGWMRLGDNEFEESPHLPVLLIWHPDWSKS